jgi:hypothetical protein
MADDQLVMYEKALMMVVVFVVLTAANLYFTLKVDGGKMFGKYKLFTMFNLILFTLAMILSGIIVGDSETDEETSDIFIYTGLFLPFLLILTYGALSFSSRQLAPGKVLGPAAPAPAPAAKGGGRRRYTSR